MLVKCPSYQQTNVLLAFHGQQQNNRPLPGRVLPLVERRTTPLRSLVMAYYTNYSPLGIHVSIMSTYRCGPGSEPGEGVFLLVSGESMSHDETTRHVSFVSLMSGIC